MKCEVTSKPCRQAVASGLCEKDRRRYWIAGYTGKTCVWERRFWKKDGKVVIKRKTCANGLLEYIL